MFQFGSNDAAFTLRAPAGPTYTIATSASPMFGGYTSGDGTYNSGATVTVVATPSPGYVFANWTENGTPVSTLASYSFTAGIDRTLVANFTLPPTATPTAAPSPSPTTTPVPCVGDCNGNNQVTVDEILAMVNTALGKVDVSLCRAGDANHDLQITIDEILTAVNHALNGCGSGH